MANQYSQVFELVKQTENIAQSFQLPTSTIASEIQHEASNKVLNITLYGAYNAGKSTLINVLSGREVAPVADIPKTDKVDRYQWNDYVLLDTPGINAPIKDREVTAEQLSRSSVILFVIRDGDMDSKDVYDRLFDLLRRNKKIFIVLNNQLENAEQKQQAAEHIRQILVNLALAHQVDLPKLAEIEIVAINLHTAFKGRVQNQEKLLEHSGYNNFIECFNAWTMQQNSERQHFNGFKNFVNERWFMPLLGTITSHKSAQDQEKSQALLEIKNELIEQKNVIFNRVSDVIRQQATSNKSAMMAILENNRDEYRIKSEMEGIFQKMSSAVAQTMQKELSSFNFNFNSHYSVPTSTDVVAVNNAAGQIGGLVKILGDENTLKQGLMLARDLKLPGLAGMSGKAVGGLVGKIAPVLQIIFAVFDVFSAQNEEAERNAQRRSAMLQAHQTIDRICTDFMNDAYQAVEQAVYPIFDQKIAEVQRQLEALKSENSALDEAFNKVIESQTKMLAIQW